MTSKHTHAASDSIAYIPTLGEWGTLLRKHGPKIVNSLWRIAKPPFRVRS